MLVTVGRFLFAYEAHNLASRLMAEGLFAVSQFQGLAYVNWRYTAAVGGFRVWVAASDLEAARVVIQKSIAGEYLRELADEFGPLEEMTCPSCGSPDFLSRSNRVDIVLAALLLLLGVSMTARPVVHQCENCRTKWQGE